LNVFNAPIKEASDNAWVKYEWWAECDPASWTFSCPAGADSSCLNVNEHCYDLAGITSLCFTESQTSIGNSILNVMSYLIVNFFGIALMWMVVFAALKSSKITEWVTGKIQELGQDLAKSVPILPFAGGLSYNDIKKTKDEYSRIPNKMANRQGSNLSNYIQRMEAKNGEEKWAIQKKLSWANSTEANDVFSKGLAAKTSIYDYGATWVAWAAAAAGVTGATSIEDIAADRGWYNWLRQQGGNDISGIGEKFNKINVADEKIDVDQKLYGEIRDWLEKQAVSSPDKMKSLWNQRFYDKGNKEFIQVLDTGIKVIDAKNMENEIGKSWNVVWRLKWVHEKRNARSWSDKRAIKKGETSAVSQQGKDADELWSWWIIISYGVNDAKSIVNITKGTKSA